VSAVNEEIIKRNEILLAYLSHISVTMNKRGSPKAALVAHEEHVTTVKMTLRVLKGETY
jgi:hypothetical protein